MAAGDGTGPHMNIYRYGANVMMMRWIAGYSRSVLRKLDLMTNDDLGVPDRMMLIGERGSGKKLCSNKRSCKKEWMAMHVRTRWI